jgi:eukaryotic-like serine/threonine-protein kinase
LSSHAANKVRVIGRYALYGVIAAGGMATVHFGRLLGPAGFSRTVAIKRLHAQFASDPEFVSMFLDEARLAARIRHPNVVQTIDVVATGGELFLVMEYVPGESIARMARLMDSMETRIPHRILSACVAGTLHGLHAAHEAKDERGMPLGIVHRDISPQNVLIGTDGVPRLIDFGVAKAAGRVQSTRDGQIKGKLSYMAPEQLKGGEVGRGSDIYSVGVMLWELITGKRLFSGENEGVVVTKVLAGNVPPPSLEATRDATLTDQMVAALTRLDPIVLCALDPNPKKRFSTAKEMAQALEDAVQPATSSQVADWLELNADEQLRTRAAKVEEIESLSATPADLNLSDEVQIAMRGDGLGTSADALRSSDGAQIPAPPPSFSGGGQAGAQLALNRTLALNNNQGPVSSPFSQGGGSGIGRYSEDPAPPAFGPSTLSTSASYLGLRAPPPKRNSSRLLFAMLSGGALLLAGSCAAVWSVTRPPHVQGGDPRPKPQPSTSTSLTAALPTATAAPIGSPGPTELELPDTAQAVADAGASPHVIVKPPLVKSPAVPFIPTTKPLPTAKNACDNPFYIKDGIRMIRPECKGN